MFCIAGENWWHLQIRCRSLFSKVDKVILDCTTTKFICAMLVMSHVCWSIWTITEVLLTSFGAVYFHLWVDMGYCILLRRPWLRLILCPSMITRLDINTIIEYGNRQASVQLAHGNKMVEVYSRCQFCILWMIIVFYHKCGLLGNKKEICTFRHELIFLVGPV